MDYLRNLNFFIKGPHSQAGSTNPQCRMSAGNPGPNSQAGSANSPSQEGMQAVQMLFARQAALVCTHLMLNPDIWVMQ